MMKQKQIFESPRVMGELRLEPEEGGKYGDMNAGQIEQLMENTGGTLDEVYG